MSIIFKGKILTPQIVKRGAFFPERSRGMIQRLLVETALCRRTSKKTLQNPWPEITLGGFKRKSETGESSMPYCVAFVYAKSGNVVVRGMSDDVDQVVITERQFGNCIARMTFWQHNRVRSMWRATAGIYHSRQKVKNHRYHIISICAGMVDSKPHWIVRRFRRLPRRWIKLYDQVSPVRTFSAMRSPDERANLGISQSDGIF